MTGFLKPKRTAFAAGLICVTAGHVCAETKIDNPLDTVNEHYAVASEHYGDGKVQVHTRMQSETGSRHSVLTVNCKDQTYRTDFEGDTAPDVFPMDDYNDPTQPLDRASVAVPVVKYACEEHGHPLLEWRW